MGESDNFRSASVFLSLSVGRLTSRPAASFKRRARAPNLCQGGKGGKRKGRTGARRGMTDRTNGCRIRIQIERFSMETVNADAKYYVPR